LAVSISGDVHNPLCQVLIVTLLPYLQAQDNLFTSLVWFSALLCKNQL